MDAVIVRLCPVSAETIAVAERLRVISRHGVGVDNVDLAAAHTEVVLRSMTLSVVEDVLAVLRGTIYRPQYIANPEVYYGLGGVRIEELEG